MAQLVLFGTGQIAQLAKYYFDTDSDHEVVAFTVDGEYLESPDFEGLPVIAFEEVAEKFPPGEFHMFVALSYAKMNSLRAKKFKQARELGYKLVSFVSSKCSYLSQYPPGENCFIFEDNTIQPFVKIGDNVILWSGNHIGHHSEIKDHNFISSHVVVSGNCTIESGCFLGVNSTIGHQIHIGPKTLLGAGAIVSKNTAEGEVIVPARSVKLEKTSDQLNL